MTPCLCRYIDLLVELKSHASHSIGHVIAAEVAQPHEFGLPLGMLRISRIAFRTLWILRVIKDHFLLIQQELRDQVFNNSCTQKRQPLV
eukprot:3043709-Amphidinium_carterae.1